MTKSRGMWLAAACAALGVTLAGHVLQAQQRPPDPLIKEGATVKVSDHVYVIPDGSVPLVPNVGIIVGSRATLVVDTGLGPRNGEIVMREMAKVSANREVFVVSTHAHPEHALGEPAFPASAKILRARAQQQDIDESGLTLAETFSRRSAMTAELLKGVQFRKADVFFDKDYALDLGGVKARILWLGPAHTRGDTVVFVEGDQVLFAGDIVMNRFLAFASPTSRVKSWLAALDVLAPLRPRRVVPSHGDMGDASFITKDRTYLTRLQARVVELKAQGRTVDAVVTAVTKEMQEAFPEWTNSAAVTPAATAAYSEAP